MIPQVAKPVFLHLLEVYRAAKGRRGAKIVDLGCSYGVNAALLKYDLSMEELYRLYGNEKAKRLSRAELIARDRRLFAADRAQKGIEVVGMDAAERAAAYAEQAEIIDEKIVADLEQEDLAGSERLALEGADLIVSTGCVGYISERTIGKVVEASRPRRPWMAHFVLRMFAFEPIRQALAERGYVTAKGERPVRQRMFASPLEREQVLDRLVGMGIDPSGLETEGWYHADLYVSRPAADMDLVPATQLVAV